MELTVVYGVPGRLEVLRASLLLDDRPNKYALRVFSAADLRLLQVILD